MIHSFPREPAIFSSCSQHLFLGLSPQDDGPKGQFAVDRVKIVELLQPHILGKEYPHVFQVHDGCG